MVAAQKIMITILGSINVDIVFRMSHLPAPGETVLCPRYETVAGGKGANQALAAARAGGDVAFVGSVGRDGFAEIALKDLKAAGVDLSATLEVATPTASAACMVDASGENSIVVASGANLDTNAEQLPNALLMPGGMLVMQMEIPYEENWAAIERARARGVKIMLSVAPAAPVPTEYLDQVDFILVNELEGRAIAKASSIPNITRDVLPKALADRHGALCILTIGSEGVIAANPHEEWRVPALSLEKIVDTTGAGDAFAGCFAAELTRGVSIEGALRFAVVGAGLSCSGLGAQPSYVDRKAIRAAMSSLP